MGRRAEVVRRCGKEVERGGGEIEGKVGRKAIKLDVEEAGPLELKKQRSGFQSGSTSMMFCANGEKIGESNVESRRPSVLKGAKIEKTGKVEEKEKTGIARKTKTSKPLEPQLSTRELINLHAEEHLQAQVNVMIWIVEELEALWKAAELNTWIQVKGLRALNENFQKQNGILEKVMAAIGVIAVTKENQVELPGGESGVVVKVKDIMEVEREPKGDVEEPKF
ncbi:hypothetical protein BU17DRAFT_79369 [Hysterangium stoloniferum]|nr:hypothetical protein BU17DRAFT_79369 [Hysterangium stoloniferum]